MDGLPDSLNRKGIDALDLEALYEKSTDFWFASGEKCYVGCPIGHAGHTGPSSDPNEPYNDRIATFGGIIGNLEQSLYWLKRALEYEKEKQRAC